MAGFFSAVYATLIGFFISTKPTTYGLYKTLIFSSVGWQTTALALLVAVFFYYVLYGPYNWGLFNRRGFWLIIELLLVDFQEFFCF